MIREGVKGVDFISANTDAQALSARPQVKVQLGITGLGAGSKPEAGRAAAQESRRHLAAALEGAHMVFITGGMGGGTGTGAAPVVAEIAKLEMGLLTVAVVTKPFDFENRIRVAESGIEELTRHVDSLIVVLNDKLLEVSATTPASRSASARPTTCCARRGRHRRDHQRARPGQRRLPDVRTVMAEMGRAMMGSAEAAGMDRARIAAEQAAVSPLLEGTESARCVLINITASKSLKMSEVRDAVKTGRPSPRPKPSSSRHRVRRHHGRPHPHHRGRHRTRRAAPRASR